MKVEVQQSNSVLFNQLIGGQGFKTQAGNLYIKMDMPINGYNSIRVKYIDGDNCFIPYWVNENVEVYPVILKIETN